VSHLRTATNRPISRPRFLSASFYVPEPYCTVMVHMNELNNCFLGRQIPSQYGAIQIDNPRLRHSLALFGAKPAVVMHPACPLSSTWARCVCCFVLLTRYAILGNRYALCVLLCFIDPILFCFIDAIRDTGKSIRAGGFLWSESSVTHPTSRIADGALPHGPKELKRHMVACEHVTIRKNFVFFWDPKLPKKLLVHTMRVKRCSS